MGGFIRHSCVVSGGMARLADMARGDSMDMHRSRNKYVFEVCVCATEELARRSLIKGTNLKGQGRKETTNHLKDSKSLTVLILR